MSFAENLRYIMTCRDMSQAQVTQAGGFSAGSVHQWTHGKSLPYSRNVDRLCRVLHCSRADLYGDSLPTHYRKWSPDRDHCEEQLKQHLSPAIGPEPCTDETVHNMAVIAHMTSRETQNEAADSVLPPALLLSDLQALFDACVDDFPPSDAIAQFGKQVYQLMVENRKENTK